MTDPNRQSEYLINAPNTALCNCLNLFSASIYLFTRLKMFSIYQISDWQFSGVLIGSRKPVATKFSGLSVFTGR